MSGDLLRVLVQDHLASALELAECNGAPPSSWRVRLLERLGRCGHPHHGFVWWRCDPCGEDRILALSCKQRLVCPRCGAGRMAQTAAHLVDHVLPEVPYRQWVVALPHPLHQLLAWRPDLLRRVGRTCFAAVQRHLLHRAGVDRGVAGGLVFVQSFTQTVGRFVHLHIVATDGVFLGNRTAITEPGFNQNPMFVGQPGGAGHRRPRRAPCVHGQLLPALRGGEEARGHQPVRSRET